MFCNLKLPLVLKICIFVPEMEILFIFGHLYFARVKKKL